MWLSVSSPAELAAQLQAELARGETVLCLSHPLAAQWTAQDWARQDPIAENWPPLIPGSWEAIGETLSEMANNILYVVTDRRAMLVFGTASMGNTSRPGRIVRMAPGELLGSKVTERADGSGDLLFPRVSYVRSSAAGDLSPQSIMGFYGIADVKAVDELIRGICERQEASR